MKKAVKIGICGLGTVGAGTAQCIQQNASIIKNRTGVDFQLTRAATIDPYDHLDIDFSNMVVTNSVDDILNDPEIDVVVELIGGDGLAKKIMLEAFDRGKSVVTANKALLAKHSEEVFSAAYKSSGCLGFEASVGGGIPIIRSVREGFAGDKIDSFSGIMNGTANYILSSMTNDKTAFAVALKDAQEKGYAEADPTFDIEGIDTAHKVAILMSLSFNGFFRFDQLYIEGISAVDAMDIEIATSFGYKIKLLGMAKQSAKGYEGRVHPALVKMDSMLAGVQGAFNAISVYGNFVGHTMSYGAGAGSHPTASAVVADIIEIGRHLTFSGGMQVPPLSVPFEHLQVQEILPIEKIDSQYYLHFRLLKSKGSLTDLEKELQKEGVSILNKIQLDSSQEAHTIHVGILTHSINEGEMQKTLKRLKNLPFIEDPINLIRVESS